MTGSRSSCHRAGARHVVVLLVLIGGTAPALADGHGLGSHRLRSDLRHGLFRSIAGQGFGPLKPLKPLRAPDVRYVPTPHSVVEAMLELARVTASDVVYDLGSGDGRIPITAAEKFGARGVGIDIDPFQILQANGNLARSPARSRVVFRNEDLFEAEIQDATVVTLFLFPTMRARLVPFLKRSLRPGTRIVAYHFDLGPEWPADTVVDVDGAMIYLWTVK